MPTVEHLRLDLLENLLSQCNHLLNEFRPQLSILKLLKNLKVFLLLSWSHNSVTVSVIEEVRNHAPYSIFLFNRVRCSFLFSESVFKVLL
jgi:hypothetical protein